MRVSRDLATAGCPNQAPPRRRYRAVPTVLIGHAALYFLIYPAFFGKPLFEN